MDFSFTEDQEALRQLTRKILDDQCTHERLKAVEATPDWFHRSLWSELAKSNLLGVALPEDVGGSGLGFFELFTAGVAQAHAALEEFERTPRAARRRPRASR